MSKDKDSQSLPKNDQNKNSQQEELNRRKALKTILGASSLMVINPFSMSAEKTGMLVTQSSSLTPTPSVSQSSSLTPTPSVSQSSSLTPTPSVSQSSSLTPTPSVSQSSSLTPTPSVSQSSSLTPTPSVSQSSSLTPTPSVSQSSSLTPTPSVSQSSSLTPTPSVSQSSSLTPTPSVSQSSSLTPTPSVSQSPSSSVTPTPTPSTSQTVLPVELSEFGVREEDDVIKLFWRTESETNNKGFEIQRSTDTFTFNKIGWVAGKGNSNQAVNYEFEEINVESNLWYYYRLKQIDFDGTSNFSKTIAIMINEEDKTTLKDIYPNIVTDNVVNIEISSGTINKAEIFIHHFNGQLLASKKVTLAQGNNTIRMNLKNTTSGMCVVNVKFSKGKSQTKRFIIQ